MKDGLSGEAIRRGNFMNAFGSTTAKGEGDEVFVSRSARQAGGREKAQRRNREFAAWMVGLSFAGDIAAVIGGLVVAFAARFDTPVRQLGHPAHESIVFEDYRGHFIFLTVTLLIVLFHFGLYSSGRPPRLRKVFAILLTGCGVWFLGNLALSFELNTRPIVSRIFLACAFSSTLLTLMLWHRLFDEFLNLRAIAAMLQRRILFVGWSEQSQRLLEHIDADPKHPYQVVGCLPSPSGRYDRDPAGSIETLGDYADLTDQLAEQAIDLVMVADLNPTRGALLDLVNRCEKEMVHLQIIPSCFQVLLSGLHLETTSGVPVLGISRLPLDSPWNQLLKRGVDVLGSVIGLLLSGPLIAIFGALVYLESPGPIFYRQTRLGRDGTRFHIIKIRSMKLDAEAGGVVGWSRKVDPRRLRIGSLMRSLNIDEVPQFWNVLKGEMSLVGPRPERPELIEKFKEQIPHYNARHGIKPGITGWAQVNGFRGDTDLVERIKCDLFYMENWNLLMEFQILLMTFFKRTNAA